MRLFCTILVVSMLCTALSTGRTQEVERHTFTDHGVAVPIAQGRGLWAGEDANGNSLVIARSTSNAVADTGRSPRGWMLVTDVDSGITEQVLCPEDVPDGATYRSFGVSRTGKLYTSEGSHFLEYNISSRQWTFQERVNATVLTIEESPDGMIWIGGVYRPALISYDPDTGEITDHGPMDDTERYLSNIDFDDSGWVYCGIGTARVNLVAFNPQTGERRQLLPEERRGGPGTGRLWRGDDGRLYGRAQLIDGEEQTNVHYLLENGNVTELVEEDLPEPAPAAARPALPDGRMVAAYHFAQRYVEIYDPATMSTNRIEFDYDTVGAAIQSMTAGPDGRVYLNSSHPPYFACYDPETDVLTHLPELNRGRSMGAQGRHVFGGEYTGGALWIFDTTRPWNKVPDRPQIAGGIGAADLLELASTDEGELGYIDTRDVLAFRTPEWGGQASFTLSAPEDGQYHVLVDTEAVNGWLDVQLLMNDQVMPIPVRRLRIDQSGPNYFASGPILTAGPVELEAGEHTLSIRTDRGDVPEIMVLIKSMILTAQDPEEALTPATEPNPLSVIDHSRPDVNAPRVSFAHPDGQHVMIAGAPGYGRAGGGMSIYNLETEETIKLSHEDLIPHHTITGIVPMPDGNLILSTTVAGTHGGHAVETDAVLALLNWESMNIEWTAVPVPDTRAITVRKRGADGLLYCTGQDGLFFVFDPETRQVAHQQSLADYDGGGKMMQTADGQVYMLTNSTILRMDTDTHEFDKIADLPVPAPRTEVSAILGDRIYFAGDAEGGRSNLWSYRL